MQTSQLDALLKMRTIWHAEHRPLPARGKPKTSESEKHMTWLSNASTSQTVFGSLILFNLIGLVFLIVSNLIKTYQDVIFHRRKTWIEKNIAFLESQLSVLYG